jgi:hypothetical protein
MDVPRDMVALNAVLLCCAITVCRVARYTDISLYAVGK